MSGSEVRTGGVVLVVVAQSLLMELANSVRAASWEDEFESDPFVLWAIATGPGDGFGDNSLGQFEYDAPHKEMIVFYDSSLPTVRLQRSLERLVTQDDAFSFEAVLDLESVTAPSEDFMQISFALINSMTTGAYRTGSFPEIASNTFDNLELAYYPNVSDLFGGPFVTVTVQGSAQGSTSAFDHLSFASVEAKLPLSESLVFHGHYNPLTTTLTFRVTDLVEVAVDVTELPPFGEPAGEFTVDHFAISTYFDGEDYTPESVSLLAEVHYESAAFTLLGDGDDDGDVDLVDFGGLQNCFTGSGGGMEDGCEVYDFDEDADVDLDDYAVFRFVSQGAV